ncbi:PucR family transcriptional regulator [Leucobacter muris]|uniref:PucR family transcriptional regulator n=1 Tax=Leucobacter muris TaxID=1935379 RepID=A0ABX5QBZ9_9MICO|nr:helix-turn-helix domain-containing protein [Leucobacter muris]QAB16589.1 PucR family transcriptional regulator [Leucobacter muris]
MRLSVSAEPSLTGGGTPSREAAWQPRFGVRLSTLEQRLGSDLVQVDAPAGADDPLIQALDIYDARSGEAGGEGTLLSIVSADAMRSDELLRALRAAAGKGCVGVAFKSGVEVPREDSAPVPFERLVREAGLVAVVLAPEVNWREFDALITRLLGENARSLTLAPSTGDKLFAIANTVARVFGGSVAIENHQRDILAHSSVLDQAIDELRTTGILFRRAGDAPVNERRYREVLAANGIVRFERYRSFLPRAAIAIRAGAIPLGTIWVLDPDGEDPAASPLPPERERVLRQAADLAADAMLGEWQTSTRDGARREAALRRMIAGAAQPGDREIVDPSGIANGVLLHCAVPRTQSTAVHTAEIRTSLGRYLATYVPDLVLFSDGNEITALCPASQVETVREWVVAALSEVDGSARSAIHVGLSDPHPLSTGLPRANEEARQLAALASGVAEQVGTVARLRPQLFFAACLSQLELDSRLVLPEVRQMLDADSPLAPLAETLECWLEQACSISRTAARLQVHEQTVRYRIRKLRERLGSADGDHRALLIAWAQLSALRLQQSLPRDDGE